MRAAPDQQQRLLELQAIDTRLQQLEHQRVTLPAIKQVQTLEAQLADLHRKLTDSRTAASDLQREVSQAETEVMASRDRLVKNQRRIESGSLSAKDAMSMTDDMAALNQWIATLEETQLDAMERLEAHEINQGNIEANQQQLLDARAEVAAQRDAALGQIDAEVKRLTTERAEICSSIFAELLKVYDTIRSRLGGVGAARLEGGSCQGCGLTLPPADLQAAFDAPPDEVVRCEECGRILVRQDLTPGTPSSTIRAEFKPNVLSRSDG